MAGQTSNDVIVEDATSGGARADAAVRAYARAGGSRRLIVAAVVGFVAVNVGFTWLFVVAERCGIVHLGSQFAGSGERFSWLLQRCSVPASVQEILVPDLLVMAGYWLMFTAILVGGWWRLEAPPLRRAAWVVWLPTIAAAFDTLEYCLLSALLYTTDEGLFALRGDGGLVNWLAMAVSSAKWVAVVAMIIAGLIAAAAWISRRRDPFPPMTAAGSPRLPGSVQPPRQPQQLAVDIRDVSAPSHDDQRVGICLSGGGIRSTAFSLGALSQFEAAGGLLSGSQTGSARFIAGVSGGAWAATAWTLQKAYRPAESASDAVIARLRFGTGITGYPRHYYAVNGRGGFVGAIGSIIFSSLTNVLIVGLLIYLIAWPLGLVMTHCAIDSGQLGAAYCGPQPIPADHFYGPSIVFAAAGLIWLLVTGLANNRIARTWPIGALLLGLSIFLASCLVWLPAWFRSIDDVGLAAGVAILMIALAIGVSIASGLWRLFGKPARQTSSESSRPWRRGLAAGVMLLGGTAWALAVLYVVAMSLSISLVTPWGAITLSATSQVSLVVPGLALLAMYIFLSPNSPSLHGLLSLRLRRSFGPVGDGLERPAESAVGTWRWLTTKAEVPELVLCCSRQSGTSAAEPFTISPRFVCQTGSRPYRTADYIDTAMRVRRSSRRRREFRNIDQVSSWLATTGVGVPSPTRGGGSRHGTGLMSEGNAQVGMWLPNVKLSEGQHVSGSESGSDRAAGTSRNLPGPRFNYPFKRILGWCDTDDRYVFISDGGYYDNLGLVELLRRQCDVIFCVDATEDPTLSFAALQQSLALAALEFGVDVNEVEFEDSLSNMLPGHGSAAATSATTFTLYPSVASAGAEGALTRPVTVHYLKLQATQNLSPELRRLAIADRQFPDSSSRRQTLSTIEFTGLVELGKIAGADALGCAQAAHRPNDGQYRNESANSPSPSRNAPVAQTASGHTES
ncbi:hypothetical protein AU195_16585 [Mycobacterium sp. IS-1496]|uniref:hypothetical protein n=1 Tax=Mycobacterium sp. IS-1496 TaxID=1772284 RepID=UPI0007416ADC|nr:hypothetical protein [Mycobacterium sp. IS-1496]KUI38213.1 hypothetical protein AU195_16585 [Mycobacterium sp. IS-1496]